ncbi:hypothetical protein LCGC14_2403050 [marine sediment metagenome]|uniref:Uncharacterized protein n=1 Tax=marine sediment metagenome TaxID=412755 RepID=A0A0F9E727_9ZZZZ
MRLLKHIINSDNREYYIEKVNWPLLKAITILGNRYPEATMENVHHPNSKRLLGIREKYRQFEGNGRVRVIVMAVLRILIAKIEHSPNYRDRFSWFVEELIDSGWKPRSYNHPVNLWNEPKPYGGR